MDPLTQGALGAALPQSGAKGRYVASAGLLGFFAGMAPDLDVLIRSNTDPLLFLEYHRQFTHSLMFIPFGGLICALALHFLLGRRRGLQFRESWLFCTLGYATHALLDACTTYGTMLFWPFSNTRIAWNTISIIDPLFTLPLLAGVLVSAARRRPLYARLALVWACSYMALGLVQRNTAVEMGYALAAERGHSPLRLEAKPSFANILVWKIVYDTPETFYVDAVRAGVAPRVFPGASVAKFDVDRDMPWLDKASQQARDIERFRWFSNGYIARDPLHPNRVIDIRYSMVPNEVAPLWSLELSRAALAEEHAAYRVHRDASRSSANRVWGMLTGRQ
ncbi:MAG: metal-dependent hydrolase [Halioglobus sp.]|nr:metal-dependent hydrolase [Halioglobus sp.]